MGKDVQAWVVLLLSDAIPKWLDPTVKIQNASIHLEARYWLSFQCSNISPSHNQPILVSRQEILVGSIIAKEELNLGSLKVPDIASRAQHKQTSLAFPCCRVKVVFNKKKDFEYTSVATVDITRIELVNEV